MLESFGGRVCRSDGHQWAGPWVDYLCDFLKAHGDSEIPAKPTPAPVQTWGQSPDWLCHLPFLTGWRKGRRRHHVRCWVSSKRDAKYLYELKTWASTESCTPMFIAALFIVAPTWKQRRCPSVGEWSTVCCPPPPHTMKYYLMPRKKKELSSHEKTGGILSTNCWVKEASLKRLHRVRLQLCDILGMARIYTQ